MRLPQEHSKRWMSRLDNCDNWDLRDDSRKPKVIHYKITPEIEERLLDRFVSDVSQYGELAKEPNQMGKTIMMFIDPKKSSLFRVKEG